MVREFESALKFGKSLKSISCFSITIKLVSSTKVAIAILLLMKSIGSTNHQFRSLFGVLTVESGLKFFKYVLISIFKFVSLLNYRTNFALNVPMWCFLYLYWNFQYKVSDVFSSSSILMGQGCQPSLLVLTRLDWYSIFFFTFKWFIFRSKCQSVAFHLRRSNHLPISRVLL